MTPLKASVVLHYRGEHWISIMVLYDWFPTLCMCTGERLWGGGRTSKGLGLPMGISWSCLWRLATHSVLRLFVRCWGRNVKHLYRPHDCVCALLQIPQCHAHPDQFILLVTPFPSHTHSHLWSHNDFIFCMHFSLPHFCILSITSIYPYFPQLLFQPLPHIPTSLQLITLH